MDFQLITYVAIPVIGSLIAFVGRSIMIRLDVLEDQMQTKVNEQTVRTILSDKMDPLKEDIHEIKETLNKFIEIYMNGGVK